MKPATLATPLMLLALSGCTPALFKGMERNGSATISRADLYPFALQQGQTEVYNMELTFRNTTMSGLMAVEPEGNNLRLVCTSVFGSTLIDALLTSKGMQLYGCAEQLKHKKMLHLLEKDFKTVFLKNLTAESYQVKRYRHSDHNTGDHHGATTGYVLKQPLGHKYYYKLDDQKQVLTNIATDGKLTCGNIAYGYSNGLATPQTITIEHPVLKLTITLTRTE